MKDVLDFCRTESVKTFHLSEEEIHGEIRHGKHGKWSQVVPGLMYSISCVLATAVLSSYLSLSASLGDGYQSEKSCVCSTSNASLSFSGPTIGTNQVFCFLIYIIDISCCISFLFLSFLDSYIINSKQ